MAARLCRSICYPCQLCAKGCSKCCSACGSCFDNVCKSCCTGCAACCSNCSCSCCDFFHRPMAICATFTVLFAGVPGIVSVAYGIKAAADGKPCGNLGAWLIVQAVLMFLQVCMAIYLFRRMSKPYDRSNPHDRDFVARMSFLVCEDIGVALYILVLIAVVVWQIMGAVWLSSESEGGSCSSETLLVCSIMQSFMWAVLLTGAILTLIRFVHAWCVLRCCPSLHKSFYGRWISRNLPGLLPAHNGDGQSVYENAPTPSSTAKAGDKQARAAHAEAVPPPQSQPEYGGTGAQKQRYTGPYRDNGSQGQGTEAYAGAVPVSKNVSGKNTGRTQLPSASDRVYADASAQGPAGHQTGQGQPKATIHVAGAGAAASPKTHVEVPAHLVPGSSGATAPQQQASAPAPAPAPAAASGGWFAAAAGKLSGGKKSSGVW